MYIFPSISKISVFEPQGLKIATHSSLKFDIWFSAFKAGYLY